MKNFFSLLLALMFSCTFTVCAFAAEPYAENSNPPTLQDTLQEILDNPTYSNAYKEAAKKKCDYLMSVRDSGPSALTRASNSMTIYVPHTYSMDEIDTVVAQGYLDEVETKRLDNLELLDSERCEQVASVRDLYGTTHSVSYKFDPWQEAWAKFKLDGRYDTFEANILTSDDTSRDANISVEIYVDDVLVGRVDNIVRDENVRPISVSVNGGKVLMIKAINTDSASGSICYVSDTNLTVLQ